MFWLEAYCFWFLDVWQDSEYVCYAKNVNFITDILFQNHYISSPNLPEIYWI